MFNALKYTMELEKAGFSRDQAEASVKLLIDVMDENFATKSDLKELETTLRSDMKELEFKMDARFSKVDSKFQELEFKLITRLGSLMTILVGIAVALIKIR